ncbi:MAG: tetratricopeptide repeat protein [Candidatus Accumulibacter meliphilus]|jgi:protein O-GlcNAc transferase|uniref:tetratricopeptide repeat protein n=1 Tax=Candidatus Accumulibacter meliphilus TaxID=2211374 RepID=UPI002FC3E023
MTMVNSMGTQATPDPLSIAMRHHQGGRFAEAEAGYQGLLKMQPNHADAWHLSGVLAAQQKKYQVAVERIERALALKPHEPVFLGNLGNAYLENGQLGRAIACYQEVLQLRPDETEIGNRLIRTCERQLDLAIEHQQAGRLADAESSYLDVLRGQPERADAWHLLGMIAYQRGQYDTAIERIERAIELTPQVANFYNTLGSVRQKQRRFSDALTAYHRALALQPTASETHANLAKALLAMGQVQSAISSLRTVFALDPVNVAAHILLVDALQIMGNHDEATTTALRAVELDPEDARAHGQLAVVLRRVGRTTEAVQACRRSLELAPGVAGTNNNLAQLLKDQGRLRDALVCYRKAIQLNPADARIHSNLLFNLHYVDPYDAPSVFAEHRLWAKRHDSRDTARAPIVDRNPERRLRLGYVSADLKSHSVAFFLEPLLAAHNRRAFEVVCYSNSFTTDTTTVRLRALTDAWHDIAGLSDEQAHALIESHAVDILVDLSGHTKGNRLPLFTRKPAPVQVTYLGYPDTTGCDAIDYRFTDARADPPGNTEQFHSEQLLRLRDGFLCYQPPRSCPQVGQLPMLHSGRVTFGSFNKVAKVSPTVIGYWAEILAAVANSRLLLKSSTLADSDTREHIQQQFHARGIPAERLELIGWRPATLDHLSLYGEVDIALDTFPYHGTTTTCEALWMGVPVVSLAGPVHVSRVGVSLLHAVGLAELSAESPQDYVRKAVELATDSGRLTSLRGTLREKVQASPLTDAKRIVSTIEDAYRCMWRQFCSAAAPAAAEAAALGLNVREKVAR